MTDHIGPEPGDPSPANSPGSEEELAALLEEITSGLENLDRHHGTLLERVDGLDGSLSQILTYLKTRPGGPWFWKELEGLEAAELWGQLFEWVAWLERRYVQYLGQDRYGLRPCWYKHPLVVEHLTALMVSHAGAYRTAQSAPSAALFEWHERSLWPTLERIRDFWNKCTTHQHVDLAEKAHPLTFDEEDFETFVTDGTGIEGTLAATRAAEQKAKAGRAKKPAEKRTEPFVDQESGEIT
ncbi:hypothetical protein [Subtercola vilae]|uniref:DUF4913 domain-containing protein n=1 Tax=Subtercola vilae TaxID=2056433 RepID=A0A4T2BQQ0_9MICO|nr:hypothetical protein [Subtercola vilae]TIH33777.1 hypothetical protein D4765_13925 [Subtercola vilae]